jgi:hypothetical protein
LLALGAVALVVVEEAEEVELVLMELTIALVVGVAGPLI